jgi:ATP-dependent DNA helicase RecG
MHRLELERYLADLESDRVERTISLTDFDKFAEAICAFAMTCRTQVRPGIFLSARLPMVRQAEL